MRKLLFLFALIILASCGEKKTTHLHFKTELTTLNEQVLEMREQIESGGMDLYSNGEDTRVEMDLSGTMLTSIYNKGLDKLNLLMQAPYASIVMQPDTEEMTQIKQMQDLSEYTVKVLDEVIEIQGYSCKKAELTDSQGTITYHWFTDEISVNPDYQQFLIAEIPGVSLQFESKVDKTTTITYTCDLVEILPENPKLYDMSIPEGYTLQKMQGL